MSYFSGYKGWTPGMFLYRGTEVQGYRGTEVQEVQGSYKTDIYYTI